MSVKLKNAQIWKDNDSRAIRFVQILDNGASLAKAKIKTVFSNFWDDQAHDHIREVKNAQATFAQQMRFGHSKGYSFVANNLKEFLAGDNEYTRQQAQKSAPQTIVSTASAVAEPAHTQAVPSADVGVVATLLSAPNNVKPEQIWLSNDNRNLRFVQVLSTRGPIVDVRNAYVGDQPGEITRNYLDSEDFKSQALFSHRFNGKSKGFTLVAENAADFGRNGYKQLVFKSEGSWQETLAFMDRLKAEAAARAVAAEKKAARPLPASEPGALRNGQIWRANDGRALRYVIVRNTYHVLVQNAYVSRVDGQAVEAVRGGPEIRVSRDSFNGKSKGFSLVASSLKDFVARGLDKGIFDKNAHWKGVPKSALETVAKPEDGVQSKPAVQIEVEDAGKRTAIEAARKLVAQHQLWQERCDKIHLIEVVGIEGDYAYVVTRYVGDDVNAEATFAKSGRQFEVRLDAFLLENKKFHLVTKTR